MAGKPKFGLDYFSLDTDIIQHIKIRRLTRTHGALGFSTFIVLLVMTYQKGQSLQFDSIDDLVFAIAECLHASDEKVREVLDFIVELNLIDSDLFNKGYISSKGIQERYVLATKRRKIRLQDKNRLLDENEIHALDENIVYNDGMYVNIHKIDVDNNDNNVNNNKQSKSKNKVKKN